MKRLFKLFMYSVGCTLLFSVPAYSANILMQLVPVIAAAANKKFTMLFASDAQVGLCSDFGHKVVVDKMNQVATANGNTVGMIFNGDIAQTGIAHESLPFWSDIFVSGAHFPVYPGLGNHDYENYYIYNLSDGDPSNDWEAFQCAVGDYADWGVDACTVMMLDYLDSVEADISLKKRIDPASRSYAFWEKGYLFVQLNYYPSYEKDLTGDQYDTGPSIAWAKELLADNENTYRLPVVLNVHSYKDVPYSDHSVEIQEIISAPGGGYVVGVFTGHVHTTRGYVERVGDVPHVGNYYVRNMDEETEPQTGAIPVWYSGSTTNVLDFQNCGTGKRSFLEVEFRRKSYNVYLWEGDSQTKHYSVSW
jgi:hypothetical protein